MQATGNAKSSDSVWVQFSDAQVNGAPAYPIHTTWVCRKLSSDSADRATTPGLGQRRLLAPAAGERDASGQRPPPLRIQVRFSGVQVDQIVLTRTRISTPGILSERVRGITGTLER
jgi:hypothetical protein